MNAEKCPVCPFGGLKASDLTCPSCGTDLAALRRVQELPLVFLDDALRALSKGDVARALPAAEIAAAFACSRPLGLLALGDAKACLGDHAAAERDWREAGRLGLSDEVRARLAFLAEMNERAHVQRLAGSLACPNPACRERGRRGGDNIALARFYGRARAPLWRCRSCGATFSGRRGSLLFRSRMPADRAYRVIEGLLGGKPMKEVAVAASCSPATVRRLAARAVALGPPVVDEVADGLGRPASTLRRRWLTFAAQTEERGDG